MIKNIFCMICPHCLIGIAESWYARLTNDLIDNVDNERFQIHSQTCTECEKLIIKMTTDTYNPEQGYWEQTGEKYPYPKKSNRLPIPKIVPKKFSKDYFEAIVVLDDSPNASAALSRRVLQHILEDVSEVSKKDRLDVQIKEARKKERFDPKLDGLLDYVRKFGNFGVHPFKDDADKIIDIESGEAETVRNH